MWFSIDASMCVCLPSVMKLWLLRPVCVVSVWENIRPALFVKRYTDTGHLTSMETSHFATALGLTWPSTYTRNFSTLNQHLWKLLDSECECFQEINLLLHVCPLSLWCYCPVHSVDGTFSTSGTIENSYRHFFWILVLTWCLWHRYFLQFIFVFFILKCNSSSTLLISDL